MYVPPLGIVHILFIKLFHHISYTMLFEMEDQLKGILLDLLNLQINARLQPAQGPGWLNALGSWIT